MSLSRSIVNKNILVTGGAGFIGTNLIEALVLNNKVISIDDYSAGRHKNHVKGAVYLTNNTVDAKEWQQKLKIEKFVPDVVFHLGEYAKVTPSFVDVERVMKGNLLGTFQVVEYCKYNSIKLIYAGSSTRFSDNNTGQDQSPYAWTKAKNIELIKNYSKWYGLEYSIAYFYNVYGPKQDTWNNEWRTVIDIFTTQKLHSMPLTIVKPGNQVRDFTYVGDIVNGLILIALKGKQDEFQLGTGKEYSMFDLAALFKSEYIMIPERAGERLKGKATEIAYSYEKLGWKPTRTLEEWIGEL